MVRKLKNGLSQSRCHKRGMILIATLWILVILAIFALGLGRTVSSQVVFAARLRDRAISLHLAKAAVKWAAWELENDKTPDFDSIYELKTMREKEFGDKKFCYYLVDEESKINVNTALPKILDGLPEIDSEIAKSIRGSRYRPFQLKEELLFVEGMDEEIYGGIKGLVTVYGDGRVNFNTASREVFEVLGLDSGLIDRIINFRAGKDGEEGTGDDNVFENAGAIIADLSEYSMLSGSQMAELSHLLGMGLVKVKSDYLNITAETEILGRTAKKITALIKKTDKEDKVLYWNER